MNWATLKGQVRRLLKDTNSATYKWSEDDLLDYVGWSLDALCSHTAIATATSFVVSGIDYVLPDNIYEPLNRSGAVYLDDGISKVYLNSVRFSQLAKASLGYYLEPDSVLHLVKAPTTSTNLLIKYFAYYPHPTVDADLILIPSWATAALCYRIVAYAYSPFAGRSANIRQWGQRPDTGKPTDNPLAEIFAQFMELYEVELDKYPLQQRENYFKS